MVTRRNRPLGFATVAILTAIRDGRRHGLDIMHATGRPSGTVYATLSRMEERGIVRGKWEPQAIADRDRRPRRRYYELTRRGRIELEKALDLFGSLPDMSRQASPARGRG